MDNTRDCCTSEMPRHGLFAISSLQQRNLFADLLLRYCSIAASSLLHRCDAAAVPPLCRCDTTASQVSLHFSFSFFFFLLPFSFLLYSSIRPSSSTSFTSSSKHWYAPTYCVSVHQYRAACAMPPISRHTGSDWLSVHGPPATRRYRQKPTVGSRLREKLTVGGRLREKSTVGGRLREKSTVGDRLRKKRGRKRRGKEEKRRGEEIIQCRPRPRAIATRGSPTRHRRPPVARTRGRFFSRARRRNVSSRGEKD
ncbi:hypothetical protein GW17_00027217 [Ensete ventricosum]|nr:hypothetical protein GW17_00027217 [Ensete ventricosum]